MTRRRERAGAPTGTRRAAREFAFRVLFEAERGSADLAETQARAEASMRLGDDTYAELSDDALAFARELLNGVGTHRAEIDALLSSTIRGWNFEQMAQTDLNILRLAVFEMTHLAEPHPPVIESAARIARKFGGEDSGRFVNGVLGGLSRDLAHQGKTAPSSTPAPDPSEEPPA